MTYVQIPAMHLAKKYGKLGQVDPEGTGFKGIILKTRSI